MWMPTKSWMPLKKIKTHSNFFGMQKGWLMASLMQRRRKNFGRDGEPCPSLTRQNSGCNLLDMKCCFLVGTWAILPEIYWNIPESCFKNLKGNHRGVIDRLKPGQLPSLRIAFILCLNVLWMAFELQFSGTLAGYEMKFFSQRPIASEDSCHNKRAQDIEISLNII